MTNIAHISETAFISILVSAIEAFPSKYEGSRKPKNSFPEGEVYGLLFGQRINKNSSNIFNITIATPMQTLLEKTDSTIHPSVKHFERIKTVIEAYPMYQFLGTFHSHPFPYNEYKSKNSADFSDNDKESAIDEAELLKSEVIEVIIGITYLQRKRKENPTNYYNSYWIENYCGNYKYTIAAYITKYNEKELIKVDNLICPFALGIGNYDLMKKD